VECAHRQAGQLAGLRDSLLPLMLSGRSASEALP